MGILIGVFIVAIYTDMKYYRIPNLLIIFGMVLGLIWRGRLMESFICMVIVFMVFYPFYLMGGIGAGDIKLFMMTACFVGKGSLINFIIVTLFIAAVICVIKLAAYKESRQRLIYLGRYARKVVLTGAFDVYEVDKEEKRTLIRIAVPAFISLVLMCGGVY